MISAKTVCVVARQRRPPELVAALRDADTDTCRELRAIPSGLPRPGRGGAQASHDRGLLLPVEVAEERTGIGR